MDGVTPNNDVEDLAFVVFDMVLFFKLGIPKLGVTSITPSDAGLTCVLLKIGLDGLFFASVDGKFCFSGTI